ncbi:MAG: NAD+ synthase [Acidimicrobiales bacterium]|nr:NAD+ synthase [Acidimicrobiales bacterium]
MPRLRIAACQLNPVVGDLDGNVARVLAMLAEAEETEADLAVFPELCLVGYPPEDLLLKPGFVADTREALARVARATGRCAAVVGFVHADQDLHNAAAVCADGAVVGIYHKRVLPNYTVFDEQRYFVPGRDGLSLYVIGGAKVGVSICEDAWSPTGPVAEQAAGGAELVVNLNASPYAAGRLAERVRMLSTRAADASCALVYVNQVGGQDELVFDGASLVLDEFGELVASARQFREELLVVDVEVRPSFRKRLLDPRGRPEAPPLPTIVVSEAPGARSEPRAPSVAPVLEPVEEVYEALVLGTRDYVRKNGFGDVVVALSGGIDSSLVATIATDALGPEHVHGISMPSRYSSEGSLSDASSLATALGIELWTVPIEPAHVAFGELLGPVLRERASGVTDENLQSRIRGVVVMAITNALGWMVLTTGNKSELATGYWTLYGDSAGGFAVIKDVPKMLAYELARFRNARAGRDLIPQTVLEKPPSAELRPDQRDDQSLPSYALLDPVLHAYVDEDHTAAELLAAGVDPELVARVASLVDRAEYKRRQTPIGPRVTSKSFGKDRRMPITNRYRSLGPEASGEGR